MHRVKTIVTICIKRLLPCVLTFALCVSPAIASEVLIEQEQKLEERVYQEERVQVNNEPHPTSIQFVNHFTPYVELRNAYDSNAWRVDRLYLIHCYFIYYE